MSEYDNEHFAAFVRRCWIIPSMRMSLPSPVSGASWRITFLRSNNGSLDTLYFTDGINGETDGLFAAISRR
jgi:hypothetical protein